MLEVPKVPLLDENNDVNVTGVNNLLFKLNKKKIFSETISAADLNAIEHIINPGHSSISEEDKKSLSAFLYYLKYVNNDISPVNLADGIRQSISLWRTSQFAFLKNLYAFKWWQLADDLPSLYMFNALKTGEFGLFQQKLQSMASVGQSKKNATLFNLYKLFNLYTLVSSLDQEIKSTAS